LTPESTLLADPYALIGAPEQARNPRIARPPNFIPRCAPIPPASSWRQRRAFRPARRDRRRARRHVAAISSQATTKKPRACVSPIDDAKIGEVAEADAGAVGRRDGAAHADFRDWSATSVETRAARSSAPPI